MDPAPLAFVLATLRLSTPLVIAAAGELVAERAGVLNIGIEGMVLAGAFAAWATGSSTGSVGLACAAGAAAGASLAGLFAFFVLGRQADPVVCGTGLNLLALGATGSLHRALYPVDVDLDVAPSMGSIAGLNGFLCLALLLIVGVAVFLSRTRAGLSLRAVGERAEAAHAHGIAVVRTRLLATLFGGICAGLSGASLVLWISDSFVEGMSSGRGFIALALVLFGAFRPARLVAGALLFGAASALQFRLQALGWNVPYSLMLMTPYVLTLVVLALAAGRVRPPADLARPFDPRG